MEIAMTVLLWITVLSFSIWLGGNSLWKSSGVKGYEKVLRILKDRKITKVEVCKETKKYVFITFDGQPIFNLMLGLQPYPFSFPRTVCFRVSNWTTNRSLDYAIEDLNGATVARKKHVIRALKECGVYDIVNNEVLSKRGRNI